MPIVITVFVTVLIATLLISSDAFEFTYEFTRAHEDWELDEIILVWISGLIAVPILFGWYVVKQNRKLRELLDQRNALTMRLTETNEELLQANEAKSEFVATMSHEIRTPLTSIKGALGLARTEVEGHLPQDLKKLLDIAYRNTDRLTYLIDDILDYSKIEAGELKYMLEPLEVSRLVGMAIEANQGYGQQFETVFVAKANLPDVWIQGDENRLMQVFSNLLSNAAKFSSRGRSVEIAVARHGDKVRFSVKDYGCGIPEEFRDNVFDRFSRADQSNTRTAGGTGLGLNITANIVEEHGGTIDFVSEVNVGTTFYFDLPEYTGVQEAAAS